MTHDTYPSTFPTATKICVAGLLTAATGIVVQYLGLPQDFPTVPPGPIILTAAAAVVALGRRWRWSPVVGIAVALMVLIGGALSGGVADNLSVSVGPAIGAVVMLVGLVTAVASGVGTIARHPTPEGE